MLGAARVIAIDPLPERLAMARSLGAITFDYSEEGRQCAYGAQGLTGGAGPDSCIDCSWSVQHIQRSCRATYDKIKVALTDGDGPSERTCGRPIQAVRTGGTLSIPGCLRRAFSIKVPFGAAFGKGITHGRWARPICPNYMKPLRERIEMRHNPFLPTSSPIAITLDQAPGMYKLWRDKEENVTKIVIDPWGEAAA